MLHLKQIQTIEVNKEKNVRKYTRSKQHNSSKETFSSKFELYFQKLVKGGILVRVLLGGKKSEN